jgi:hypothetical protein
MVGMYYQNYYVMQIEGFKIVLKNEARNLLDFILREFA